MTLDETMNWIPYRPIWPFAFALPLRIALLAWALMSAGQPTLFPLLLAVVFIFPFFAARRVPSAPIRAAVLTAVPALFLQFLGLVVLGFTAFSGTSASPDHSGIPSRGGLMFVSTIVIGGNIISMCLVSLQAGWIVKLTENRERGSSNQALRGTAEGRADAAPGSPWGPSSLGK